MSPTVAVYETASAESTIALGRELAATLPRRAAIFLIGNLGAGKTTLAKGILQGLGLAKIEEVTSPTFTLIHEYGPNAEGARAYHIDLYRLDHLAQLATLGLDEILDQDAVVLMEWGERFPVIMPAERMEIRMTPVGDDVRKIEVLRIEM